MTMSMFQSTTGTEAPKPQDVSPKESAILGIGFAWDLGFTIAVPAILFGFAGGYADKYFGSSPLLLFAGIGLAFITSAIIIARKLRDILNRLPKVLPKKKDPIDIESAKEQELLHELFRPPSE